MIIETHGLTKTYGSKTACNNIDLEVKEGDIYGFLGPNGAGKSTCIKMLTGLVIPTSGNGMVLGRPLGDVKAREKLGYLPELFRYQDWMTGKDLLRFHERLFRLKKDSERIDKVLKQVGLFEHRNFKVGSYSKGMQQRIGLGCALLPNPKLLFLDEPTSALDPIGRKDVRDIILSLKEEGKTVFLNSHLLSEVEAVCDSVTIIHNGVVAKSATMSDLLQAKITLTVRAEGVTEIHQSYIQEVFASQLEYQADGTFSIVLTNQEQIPAIAAFLVSQGVNLYEMTLHRETLESAFLRIVGKENLP